MVPWRSRSPGHLQIVLLGDRGRVADPFTDNVNRKFRRQIGLSAGAQVVEQPGPRCELGAVDQPQHFGSQVQFRPLPPIGRRSATQQAEFREDPDRTHLGGFVESFQMGSDCWQQRDHAEALAVNLRFGRRDLQPVATSIQLQIGAMVGRESREAGHREMVRPARKDPARHGCSGQECETGMMVTAATDRRGAPPREKFHEREPLAGTTRPGATRSGMVTDECPRRSSPP
jgi:hypothetical protein